jgi:uncharacterized protein (DUF1015 family)
VPRLEPFAALRYQPDRVDLDDVIAPPYDVIAPDEQLALERRSPYNSVRVELPRDDDGRSRYAVAHDLLAGWRSDGVLAADPAPALYGYRMGYPDPGGGQRRTTGVIAAVGLEPPGAGAILPHEQTTPKAKTDRLELLRATATNLSPIWLLSLAPGLSDLVGSVSGPRKDEEMARARDDDGVVHELWPITEPAAMAAVAASIGSAPLVIADGHHRFETALAYQDERRHEAAGSGGPYDLVMALVVELSEDQLAVGAIHRLLGGLPAGFDLPAALGRSFRLTPTGAADATIGARMASAEAMALVTPGGTWLMQPSEEVSAAAPQDLDASRLEVALAALPPHRLEYQHGWDRAAAAVSRGDAQAAVILRPATVAAIAATGRGGARMPAKTTFFWPKPRTGMVFRPLDGRP